VRGSSIKAEEYIQQEKQKDIFRFSFFHSSPHKQNLLSSGINAVTFFVCLFVCFFCCNRCCIDLLLGNNGERNGSFSVFQQSDGLLVGFAFE